MAVYTTFFVATDSELDAGFPDWKRPLEAPVKRRVRNPFTGELVLADRWADEPDDEPAPPPRETGFMAKLRDLFGPKPRPSFGVTVIEGDYETYLQDRAHPSRPRSRTGVPKVSSRFTSPRCTKCSARRTWTTFLTCESRPALRPAARAPT